MNNTTIFLYEWKHFIRTPFKVVALLLFIIAGIYGLHNGATLYQKQVAEIDKINENMAEEEAKYMAYYDKGEKGPADRPWVDMGTPFWAIWHNPTYHFKAPSPAIVYSVGQAEQYGFYKRVSFLSSPYDADMAEEIANPERLQSGTLDFSFAMLYLLPLLLLIWFYNIKGGEADRGFLSLVYTQTGSQNAWLFSRVAFYISLLILVVLGLMLYGAFLTNVFKGATIAFVEIFFLVLFYLLLWGAAYVLILQKGNSSIGNTLQMVGVWLVFVFVIPATIHQLVSTQYPPNLMTELIDAQREDREKLYEQPDSVLHAQITEMFPEIANSPIANDESKSDYAWSRSYSALTNELVKASIQTIEENNDARNKLIDATNWLNPVSLMQNELNSISQTHYDDYQNYRDEVQTMIDKQIQLLVQDTWSDITVDKQKYLEYNQTLR